MNALSAGDKVRIIPGSKNYFKGEIESSLFEKEWTISNCDGSKTRISNGNVTLYIDISCLESISPETPSESQMPSVTLASKEQVADNSSNDDAPGWNAIEKEFERVYPGQTDPKHYGTLIKWRLGGNDPLDGISVYEGRDYWHFVTFGSTELYEKETDDPEISGYGYELTFCYRAHCVPRFFEISIKLNKGPGANNLTVLSKLFASDPFFCYHYH